MVRSPDDVATAKQLRTLSSTILSDARRGAGVIEPGLHRFSGEGTAAGRAITADCDEGSVQAVFAALDHAQPGDFLCIKGAANTAYLGDLLATNLVGRGLAGAVVDGFVRDRDRIGAMPLTIVARGVTPLNLRAKGPGAAMSKITVGGVAIAPGDWVVADSDGVIVIPPDDVATSIEEAEKSARIEGRIGELIRQGVPVGEAVGQALAEMARN